MGMLTNPPKLDHNHIIRALALAADTMDDCGLDSDDLPLPMVRNSDGTFVPFPIHDASARYNSLQRVLA